MRFGFVAVTCAMVLSMACNRGREENIYPQGAVGTAGGGEVEEFIQHAAADGMAEVQLGQLASERGSSAEVKKFAQMMVRDHSKANDELKQAVSRFDVQLPTQIDDKHRNLRDKLSNLQGAEFDREYMNAMVDGHEEVAERLDDRANLAADPSRGGLESAVNQWASKTLPAVQQHLREAREIRDRLGSGSATRTRTY